MQIWCFIIQVHVLDNMYTYIVCAQFYFYLQREESAELLQQVQDREAGVGWLAKCASAMSNNFAISSTGFKGGPPSGAQAVFIHSIRCLNAAIEPALLKVSCKVRRGPPPLGFFAWGAAIAINTHKKKLSQHCATSGVH